MCTVYIIIIIIIIIIIKHLIVVYRVAMLVESKFDRVSSLTFKWSNQHF